MHTQLSKSNVKIELAKRDLNRLQQSKHENGVSIDLLNQEIQSTEKWLQDNGSDQELEKQLIVFNQLHKGLLDAQIKITEAEKEQHVCHQQREEQTDLLLQLSVQIDQYGQQLSNEQNKLQEINDSLDGFDWKDMEVIETQLLQLPSLINNYEQQYKYAEEIITCNGDKLSLETEISGLKAIVDTLCLELQSLKNEKDHAEVHLKNLQAVVDLERQIQNYEEARRTLKPEIACPLCGSKEHPFVEDGYDFQLSIAEKKRNDQENRLTVFNQQYSDHHIKLNTLNNSISTKNQLLIKLVSSQERLVNQFEGLNELLSEKLEMENPAEILLHVESKKLEQRKLQQNLEKLRKLRKQVDNAETKINGLKESLREVQAKIDLSTQKKESIEQKQSKNSILMAGEMEKQAVLTEKIAQLLIPYGIDATIYDISETEILLKDRWDKYCDAQKNLQDWKINFSRLTTAHQGMELALSEKTKEIIVLETDC